MTNFIDGVFFIDQEDSSILDEIKIQEWEQVTISLAEAPGKPVAQCSHDQLIMTLAQYGCNGQGLILTEW